MRTVEYENKKYLIQENETVLDSLLRNDIMIPYSCQNGICQSCLMHVVEGNIPNESQKGLPKAFQEENCFLSCICKPTENIKIERISSNSQILNATVITIEKKSDHILILKLKCHEDFKYKPGQFINLINDKNLSRSYSLASHPDITSNLELHIKRSPNGKMSNWIFDELKIGDHIKIAGPHGFCFYTENCNDKPILLIGVGTGLSPLIGIQQDAMIKKHNGEIHLIHGSLHSSGIYLKNELCEIEKTNKNFKFHPCAFNVEQNVSGIHSTTIQSYLEKNFPDLSNWEIFICGNEEFVREIEQQAFLQGANFENIHSDAFVEKRSEL